MATDKQTKITSRYLAAAMLLLFLLPFINCSHAVGETTAKDSDSTNNQLEIIPRKYLGFKLGMTNDSVSYYIGRRYPFAKQGFHFDGYKNWYAYYPYWGDGKYCDTFKYDGIEWNEIHFGFDDCYPYSILETISFKANSVPKHVADSFVESKVALYAKAKLTYDDNDDEGRVVAVEDSTTSVLMMTIYHSWRKSSSLSICFTSRDANDE